MQRRRGRIGGSPHLHRRIGGGGCHCGSISALASFKVPRGCSDHWLFARQGLDRFMVFLRWRRLDHLAGCNRIRGARGLVGV